MSCTRAWEVVDWVGNNPEFGNIFSMKCLCRHCIRPDNPKGCRISIDFYEVEKEQALKRYLCSPCRTTHGECQVSHMEVK